jgi:hypothetical protein
MLSLSKPISDPDVFWHLKTGEWIWQNKTLPEKDPFTFVADTQQDTTSVDNSFPLKQYWLAQLIIYWFYRIGGFWGIIAFRCLIYLGIGLLLYYWMGKMEISKTGRLIFLIPMVYFSSGWLGERPANLSFLFLVVVVYLLEHLRQSNRAVEQQGKKTTALLRYCSLPLIMLIWGNMHAGFILGDAIIVSYMIAETIRVLNNKVKVKAKAEVEKIPNLNLTLFFVSLISILASFINPNIYICITAPFEIINRGYSGIPVMEWLSPFYYASGGTYNYLIFIFIIALPFFLNIRKFGVHSILVAIIFTALSLRSIRFIPFLILATTPFIAGAWGEYVDKTFKDVKRFYMPALVIFAFAILLVLSNIKDTVFKKDVVSPFYPAKAVEFIKAERPEGEIFNDLEFGGYLIWSLYPDYKVFIDGRRLFQKELMYMDLLSGKTEENYGMPLWKAIFSAYNIKAVLVAGSDSIGGGFTRLVHRLIEDNEWSLVFIDEEALLFLKDTGVNSDIIRRHSKPKMLAYEKSLEQAEIYRNKNPRDWTAYSTLGEINLYMGRSADALSHLESAIRLNPSLQSTSIGDLVERLKTGRDYSDLLDKIFR